MTTPTIKFPGNGDFCGGEVQNVKLQNLASAPADAAAGRFWYDSVNNKPMYYDGTNSKEFGRVYTFSTGLTNTSDTITVTDYNKLVKNIASGSNAIAIGSGSSATANYGVAIGYESSSSGGGVAVGKSAKATGAGAIQIGEGTNNLATKSLCIGFGSSNNYQLLDGTTGLIPDARISSNIARASAIPTTVAELSDSSNYALKSDLTTAYKAAGTVASASDLPTLSSSVLGNVYNVTTSFTTTSDFVEGSGKTIQVGNDIAVVDVGTGSSHSYKFSVMGDFVDISSKQDANTAVTHTASTAVGSATQPVYVNSSGVATACTYTLGKSVPSDAIFTDTDTKNTAGSTDTSSKIYLVGATSQAANPQTYSHDTAFVDANGRLNSAAPATSANDTTVATTKWVKDQGYLTSINFNSVTTALGYTPSGVSIVSCPALTSTNGVCTWTIQTPATRGGLAPYPCSVNITVYEATNSGYNVVYPSINYATDYITITLLSSSNITADSYVANLVY